jgi:hypothetical protein
MALSKIWVLVLGLALTAALGLALLVPKPAFREVSKAYAENLDRGQHNADLILRLEARDWIDAVAKLAWDGTLVDLLEQASNRRGDLKQHQAKIGGRMLALVGRIKADSRPQLLIAVDARGKQIARVGPGEDRFTPGEDGLAGFPLVEAALRGCRADDSWNLDGKLYLMTASPVISRARGRYVGALLLGQEVNEAFARKLRSRLAGTDLAFFLRGRLLAATLSSSALVQLAKQFQDRKEQIVRDGRSPAIRIGEGSGALNVILAALPGEAGEHDAFYAAIGKPSPSAGLGELIGLVQKTDLSLAQFPFPLVVGVLLAALVVGFALLHLEGSLPLRRLLEAVQRMVRREAHRIEEAGFAGRHGALAHAINEALEKSPRRATAAAPSPPPPASETGRHAALAEAHEPPPRLGGDERSALAAAGVEVEASLGVQSLTGISADYPVVKPLTVPADSPLGDRRLREERESVIRPVDLPPPAPPPASGAAAAFDLEPLLMPSLDRPPSPPAPVRLPESEAEALPSLRPGPEPAPAPPLPELPPPAAPAQSEELLPSLPAIVPSGAVPAGEDEYYRQVYKEFLAIKRQCGENVSNLTFEKFAEKLNKNRDALVSRYGCKSVKFQVYIKDGKAALKATPVKE